MANKMSEKKKSANQSEMEEPKARASERAAKSTRHEGRSKPVRSESKAAPVSAKKSEGFANSALVRFVRESYRELRYKVTWPTGIEVRNMTIAVLALSLAVGLLLGLVDVGLFQLFKFVTGK